MAGNVAPASPDAAPAAESTFRRLWLGFCTARVGVATSVLVLLSGMMLAGGTPVSSWLLGMCATWLAAALAVRLLIRSVRTGVAFDPQWVSSIGVDLLVIATLQLLHAGGFWYVPLFAVPVLMASVLGSTLLALGTAAAVTLLLLAEAWILTLESPVEAAQRFLQAGLTGIGFFTLAFLAHQLARRLAREEMAAREGRQAARVQAQVNQLVIETLSDGVVVLDSEGRVHAANPSARELLGGTWSAAELPAGTEAGWEPLLALARRTFESGEPQAAEVALPQPGTVARRVIVRARLTPSGTEAALCVVFLQDLREMEARLRTEKLAAMGRMSTAVAHEIRNPLAAILQANALLEEELQDPAQRQLCALVDQNARRLSQTVEEILDVARVQHRPPGASPAVLALDQAVAQHCGEWALQAGRQPHLALAAGQARVAFEADHLRRVLVNLLDNALRYASEAPDAIQVATRAAGTDVVLQVWSDGQALEPAVERHLFEPFFSSESRSSGLGLYICRELCERHGAVIGYRRAPAPHGDRREGNVFTVSFRTAPALAGSGPFARIAA